MPTDSLIVSVDRIEGRTIVLEGDDGRRFEVPVRDFPEQPAEGRIYVVPLGKSGVPNWKLATVDEAETTRRLKDLKRRMETLRRPDKGGDVEL